MEYNMFIDDERYPPMDGDVWVIVRTSQQAIDWITSNGYPSFISFDHDFDGDDTSPGPASPRSCTIQAIRSLREGFFHLCRARIAIRAP